MQKGLPSEGGECGFREEGLRGLWGRTQSLMSLATGTFLREVQPHGLTCGIHISKASQALATPSLYTIRMQVTLTGSEFPITGDV